MCMAASVKLPHFWDWQGPSVLWICHDQSRGGIMYSGDKTEVAGNSTVVSLWREACVTAPDCLLYWCTCCSMAAS